MLVSGYLNVSLTQLNLRLCLFNGQAFRWRKRSSKEDQVLRAVGVLGSFVLELQQKEADSSQSSLNESIAQNGAKRKKKEVKPKMEVIPDGHVQWKLLNPDIIIEHLQCDKKENEQINLQCLQKQVHQSLHKYFQLDVDVLSLYEHWKKVDNNFGQSCQRFSGVRIMQQDPVENLFSFICSANNNIDRITRMVTTLGEEYGRLLYKDEELGNFYQFPSVSRLAVPEVGERLRQLKFGYRAKYINNAAKFMCERFPDRPQKFLEQCRDEMNYEEAVKEILKLPGVGPKVADCVCLMSLAKHESIPIDTHMYKIAVTSYMGPEFVATKTLTTSKYNEIANYFRKLHGEYAGWAQSVLFSMELKHFQKLKQ